MTGGAKHGYKLRAWLLTLLAGPKLFLILLFSSSPPVPLASCGRSCLIISSKKCGFMHKDYVCLKFKAFSQDQNKPALDLLLTKSF